MYEEIVLDYWSFIESLPIWPILLAVIFLIVGIAFLIIGGIFYIVGLKKENALLKKIKSAFLLIGKFLLFIFTIVGAIYMGLIILGVIISLPGILEEISKDLEELEFWKNK